jgi:hypothetical protein
MVAITGAIKVQICALIEQRSATIVTQPKKSPEKIALIEMLRGSAGFCGDDGDCQ